MKKYRRLIYFLCVTVPLAALVFLAVSCEYIVEPGAPAWGEIVISSMSSETDPDTPGYFSATGVLNIEEGVVTNYEWESEYTVYGEVKEYYAEAGYVDFTGPDIQEMAYLPQYLKLKSTVKNSGGSWFADQTTMRVYLEEASDYEPVEAPELITGADNLIDVLELEWQDKRLTAMIDYYDSDYYTTGYYTPEYYIPDSIGASALKLPVAKTEYVYETGTPNLERVRGSLWNGEGFSYTIVTIYADKDSSGNPVKQFYYWESPGLMPKDPDIDGTAEETTINLMNGDFVLNNGDYFEIYSPNGGYYVWYHDGDTSVDPEPYGLTGIPVEWTVDSVSSIMEATAGAIDAEEDFSAVYAGNNVIVTNVLKGNVPDANPQSIDLNTFSIIQGSPYLDTTKFTYGYDIEGRLESVNIDDSEKHTFSYNEDGSIRTYTISFYDIEAGNWVENTTLTFNIPEGISFNTNDITPWIDPIGNMMIATLLPPD